MKTFENKKEFAIEMDLYIEKYKDHEYTKDHLEESWCGAEVSFWVKGKNLFAFKNIENSTYSGYDLYPLIDFFY